MDENQEMTFSNAQTEMTDNPLMQEQEAKKMINNYKKTINKITKEIDTLNPKYKRLKSRSQSYVERKQVCEKDLSKYKDLEEYLKSEIPGLNEQVSKEIEKLEQECAEIDTENIDMELAKDESDKDSYETDYDAEGDDEDGEDFEDGLDSDSDDQEKKSKKYLQNEQDQIKEQEKNEEIEQKLEEIEEQHQQQQGDEDLLEIDKQGPGQEENPILEPVNTEIVKQSSSNSQQDQQIENIKLMNDDFVNANQEHLLYYDQNNQDLESAKHTMESDKLISRDQPLIEEQNNECKSIEDEIVKINNGQNLINEMNQEEESKETQGKISVDMKEIEVKLQKSISITKSIPEERKEGEEANTNLKQYNNNEKQKEKKMKLKPKEPYKLDKEYQYSQEQSDIIDILRDVLTESKQQENQDDILDNNQIEIQKSVEDDVKVFKFCMQKKERWSLQNDVLKLVKVQKIKDSLEYTKKIRDEDENNFKIEKCINCKQDFSLFLNNDKSCQYHIGQLKFYSCHMCGGDEYYNCCNACSKCHPGCIIKKHVYVLDE